MQTGIATAFQTALDELYRIFGTPASYTSGGGAPVSCTIRPDTGESNVEIFLQAEARSWIVLVRKSEVAEVHIGSSKFTVIEATWRVDRVLKEKTLEWQLLLSKDI